MKSPEISWVLPRSTISRRIHSPGPPAPDTDTQKPRVQGERFCEVTKREQSGGADINRDDLTTLCKTQNDAHLSDGGKSLFKNAGLTRTDRQDSSTLVATVETRPDH